MGLIPSPITCPQTEPWVWGCPLTYIGGLGGPCASHGPSLLTLGYGADVQTHNLSWVWGCPITYDWGLRLIPSPTTCPQTPKPAPKPGPGCGAAPQMYIRGLGLLLTPKPGPGCGAAP